MKLACLCLVLLTSSCIAADFTDKTYEGVVRHGDGFPHALIHFYEYDGKVQGEYVINGDNYSTNGTLVLLKVIDGEHRFEWRDKYGSGELRIKFNKNKFTGRWTCPGDDWHIWYGQMRMSQ